MLEWGGTVRDLGIARDEINDIRFKAATSEGCDVFVTLGGASVGDHDLIQKALTPRSQSRVLEDRDAAGQAADLRPLQIDSVLGPAGQSRVRDGLRAAFFEADDFSVARQQRETPWRMTQARLSSALPANDQRQDYVRCHLQTQADGTDIAEPFPVQDSSMLRPYAAADALIVRPPGDPAKAAGDSVSVLHLD